jgi:hypothetical protein
MMEKHKHLTGVGTLAASTTETLVAALTQRAFSGTL